MGDVYKARDTRLNRFVAMKVLSGEVSGDPEFRRRFLQEAQAASALNHPNIITIYDIVADEQGQYIVMEYVDGQTLRQLIPSAGLAVEPVLLYANQMADALSTAHAAGIIHRDLKPANVMVTRNGLVKLLDFGLAKRFDWTPSEDMGQTATVVHAPLTMQGTIMGTVNYMSPEQAEGKRMDARSDIFSFGAVLYEMLTGESAFHGGSVLSTLSAVLRDDVRPITQLKSGFPVELEQVVLRCLRKEPEERFQSMQEVQAELAAMRGQVSSGLVDSSPTVRTVLPVQAPRQERPQGAAIWPAAIGMILLAALIGGGYFWRSRPGRGPVVAGNAVSRAPASVGNAPQPIAPRVIENTPLVLGDGIEVPLILLADIPAKAGEGEQFRLRVARDVRVNSSVAIRKGAVARGAIVDGAKKKLFVFGTKMTLRFSTVAAVDGQNIGIRATRASGRDGVSKRAVSAGAMKAKGIAALAGTEYVGYVNGPITLWKP